MTTYEKNCADCGRPMSDPGPCNDSSDPGAGHTPSRYDNLPPMRPKRHLVDGKLVDPAARHEFADGPDTMECFTLRF